METEASIRCGVNPAGCAVFVYVFYVGNCVCISLFMWGMWFAKEFGGGFFAIDFCTCHRRSQKRNPRCRYGHHHSALRKLYNLQILPVADGASFACWQMHLAEEELCSRKVLFIYHSPQCFCSAAACPLRQKPGSNIFLFSASEGGGGKTVQSNKQLRFVTVSSGAGPTYLAAPSSTGRFWGLHRSGSHHLHWTNPVISTTEFSFLFR